VRGAHPNRKKVAAKTGGSADPGEVNGLLREELDE
jgi:hypothetical protein